MHRLQRLVPAALQLTRYQPIGRIDAVVLSARMSGLIACLSECQLELPPRRRHFSGLSFERLERSVDAEWPQDAQNLRGDSLIRSEAAEGDAPLGAMVHDGTLAVVAARLAVAHVQFSAAMATSEQARENKLASARRPARDGATFSGRVVRNHTLVPFELLPTDIALVLIF